MKSDRVDASLKDVAAAGILERHFHLRERGTDPRREVLAGLSTFMTMGTVIGIGGQAGLLDRQGRLPRLNRVLLVDSFAAERAKRQLRATSNPLHKSGEVLLARIFHTFFHRRARVNPFPASRIGSDASPLSRVLPMVGARRTRRTLLCGLKSKTDEYARGIFS